MTLSTMEAATLGYFVTHAANDLNIATRWYPHGELVLIVQDKVQVAVRKFGLRAKAAVPAAARAFVDRMVEQGGWITKANEFGGTMHQFQADAYRTALTNWQAELPEDAGLDADGWAQRFASTAQG